MLTLRMKVFLLLPKNNAPGQIISVGGSSLEAHILPGASGGRYSPGQIISGYMFSGRQFSGADIFLFLLSCN